MREWTRALSSRSQRSDGCPYVVYDVFTERPFGGNQLAVVLDAERLSEEDLQRVAREFNFSETTFVYPPIDPQHSARLRIFTPTMEVPFAGHPLIGTAVALASLGLGPELSFELESGLIKLWAERGEARFTVHTALQRLATPELGLVARALGVEKERILTTAHPPLLASVGLPFTLTELDSRATLADLSPDLQAFKEGQALHPSSLDFAQFAYVQEGDTLYARMFAPLDEIPEDPATGSACATLGALLTSITGQARSFIVHQGGEMGRPSLIKVKATHGGVEISGHAVETMCGQLTFSPAYLEAHHYGR